MTEQMPGFRQSFGPRKIQHRRDILLVFVEILDMAQHRIGVAALRQELTETELRAMVRSMKRMGLDRQSAWSLFERLYAEEETE